MKQVWEFIKIAYDNLTKQSVRTLAIIIIMMPLATYLTYKGYTTSHKRNDNMIDLITKVNNIDSTQSKILANQVAQSAQISNLYPHIDMAIKASDAQVIQSTAAQMKFILKWSKENTNMLLESIDNWSNTYQRNLNMAPIDTLPTYQIGVKKK